MCGIAGYFSTINKFLPSDLASMASSMKHRGPDAEGDFYSNGVGLTHRRLSIIDLSAAANQPMFSDDGNLVVVFNGEIYNFRELASTLNYKAKTSSDTEIIIAAFKKWGPDFVQYVNGMFAIAIFDKSEQKLYLFRDRVGIKPLFYYFKNNQLAFASELKALVSIGAIKNELEINKKAVYNFLHLGYIPAPDSIYNHIYKFPQGQYAEFDGKNMVFKTYWTPESCIKANTFANEAEAKESLREELIKSVKYRLVADVPYGTFLSGGVDSSLISALAQKETNHQLKTFSIGFEDKKFNESLFARQVASHIESDHHEFILTEKETLEHLPYIFESYDEPFADASAIPTMLVSKMARQHVTMTLSGDGGDELFHGYGMYNWAERLDNPLIKYNRFLLAGLLGKMGNRYQRAAKVFSFSDDDHKLSHIFSQEQYFFTEAELNDLLLPGFENDFSVLIDESSFERQLTAAEMQAFYDLKYYLPDDLLTKVDRASMRYSLESRVPLLDHNLVEFALNVHPNLKRKGKTAKYLLKQVLFDYVPEPIFDRPKWGFGIPINRWLKTELKPLVDEYLNDKKVAAAGIVNPESVDKLLKNYYSDKKEFLYNRIWALLCLHKWYFDTFKGQ